MTSVYQHGVYLTHEEYAALLAELKILNNAGIVEVAVRNPQVMEYMQHWEGRAENAEAERDRLREAITWASVITSHGMGLSANEGRTLHSLLTNALKGDQT